MEMYTTRYALTLGVKKKDLQTSRFSEFLYDGYTCYEEGKDAFLKLEDAIQAAEMMRKKKIESLKKQIKKLEKLKFEGIQP